MAVFAILGPMMGGLYAQIGYRSEELDHRPSFSNIGGVPPGSEDSGVPRLWPSGELPERPRIQPVFPAFPATPSLTESSQPLAPIFPPVSPTQPKVDWGRQLPDYLMGMSSKDRRVGTPREDLSTAPTRERRLSSGVRKESMIFLTPPSHPVIEKPSPVSEGGMDAIPNPRRPLGW